MPNKEEASYPKANPLKSEKQPSAEIGLDQNEQVMNGNYGMAETKEEDSLSE